MPEVTTLIQHLVFFLQASSTLCLSLSKDSCASIFLFFLRNSSDSADLLVNLTHTITLYVESLRIVLVTFLSSFSPRLRLAWMLSQSPFFSLRSSPWCSTCSPCEPSSRTSSVETSTPFSMPCSNITSYHATLPSASGMACCP